MSPARLSSIHRRFVPLMTPPKIFLDEDVHHLIARTLQTQGFEALTAVAAGRAGYSDREQLEFTSANGYVLFTYNIADFPRLHHEVVEIEGGGHGGIIVGTQSDPAANARTLLDLVSTFSADDFPNELLFLNNWM
jgi:hypothetical protein